MVLKYEEYIKEGLWSKGLERAQSGEKREEELTPFDKYLQNVEWVDLGDVLSKTSNTRYAKFDFPLDIEKNSPFTIEQIKEIKKSLPPNIHIMNEDDYDFLKQYTIRRDTNIDNRKYIECESRGEKIYFNIYPRQGYFYGGGYYVDQIVYTQTRKLKDYYTLVNEPGYLLGGRLWDAKYTGKKHPQTFSIKLVKIEK